ncbi:MAG: hypothetical protein LBF37_01530 [Rickettsiales bacterium]|jgi:hypothetical protein|nr:hypothetical protein [Rickettsiales bacterium]
MLILEYEDIQKVIKAPTESGQVYSYVYAPKADNLTVVAKTNVIFCGKQTKVISECRNIKRGDWYLADGCIRSKTNKNFMYKLTLNSFDDVTFFNNPEILNALDVMLSLDNVKNTVALCKRNIR